MSSAENQHVMKRFSMHGFGNAEAAILQCAKELLENSFDALKEIEHFTTTRGAIQLRIRSNFDGTISSYI